MLHHLYAQDIVRERVAEARGHALARRARERSAPQPTRRPTDVVVRIANATDETALERLAALDSRRLPHGRLLVAEVDGDIVAAASIETDVEPIGDPFRRTAELRELLKLRARQVRRARRSGAPQAATRRVPAATAA